MNKNKICDPRCQNLNRDSLVAPHGRQEQRMPSFSHCQDQQEFEEVLKGRFSQLEINNQSGNSKRARNGSTEKLGRV